MIDEARARRREDRRAAASPGRCRAGTHQNPRCSTGSAAACSSSFASFGRASAPSPCIARATWCANFVSDPAEQSATVDRFLDELDEMAPSNKVFEDAVTAELRAASRESVAALVEAVRRSGRQTSTPTQLTRLADRSGIGRQAAAPRAAPGQASGRPVQRSGARVQLVERLLSGKVSDAALDVLKTAASQRWSSTSDLVVRNPAHRQPGAAGARRARRPDRRRRGPAVPVQPHPRCRAAADHLAERVHRARWRAGSRCSTTCFTAGASRNAADLLRQTVELLHGERADEAVRDLANSGGVAARRGRRTRPCRERTQRRSKRPADRVAHPHLRSSRVHSARSSTRGCSAGLTITVGDEVIDGSLASKLASAETHLPD